MIIKEANKWEASLSVDWNLLKVYIVLFSAIFTGLCVAKFGARPTTMTGSLIATVGIISASFVTNIYAFFLTYGIVSAIGTSCVMMGTMVPLYDYFDKHKALAIGIYMAGHSLGYFMWPPLVTILFSCYGWRGSFMILAGLQLQACFLGACLRPYTEYTNSTKDKNSNTGCSGLLSQLRVFQNKYFMFFTVLIVLIAFGYSFVPAYLPTKAEGLGISGTKAAMLVSIYGKSHPCFSPFLIHNELTCLYSSLFPGIFNCVSRIAHGFLGDAPWFRHNRLTICIYTFALFGINKIWWMEANTYELLVLLAVVDGYCKGKAHWLNRIGQPVMECHKETVWCYILLSSV